jgi:hypothetical protein
VNLRTAKAPRTGFDKGSITPRRDPEAAAAVYLGRLIEFLGKST